MKSSTPFERIMQDIVNSEQDDSLSDIMKSSCDSPANNNDSYTDNFNQSNYPLTENPDQFDLRLPNSKTHSTLDVHTPQIIPPQVTASLQSNSNYTAIPPSYPDNLAHRFPDYYSGRGVNEPPHATAQFRRTSLPPLPSHALPFTFQVNDGPPTSPISVSVNAREYEKAHNFKVIWWNMLIVNTFIILIYFFEVIL